jgi:proteasome lid subunit RPN8/RPN11
VVISRTLLDEMVAHAQEDPTNEVCGLVAVEQRSPGRAVGVYRAINMHASPLKFEIAPTEQLKLMQKIEGEGLALGGLYHSHVRSKPYPSQTDINFAANLPGQEWFIVGLADRESPDVRSYLIEEGEVREVPIEVQ